MHAWDGSTGERVGTVPEAYADAIGGVAFRPDGRLSATGGGRPAMRLWDAASLQPVTPGASVDAIAFAPDGSALVAGGRDLGATTPGGAPSASLRMWRLGPGAPRAEPVVDAAASVTTVAYSRDGRMIAWGG